MKENEIYGWGQERNNFKPRSSEGGAPGAVRAPENPAVTLVYHRYTGEIQLICGGYAVRRGRVTRIKTDIRRIYPVKYRATLDHGCGAATFHRSEHDIAFGRAHKL